MLSILFSLALGQYFVFIAYIFTLNPAGRVLNDFLAYEHKGCYQLGLVFEHIVPFKGRYILLSFVLFGIVCVLCIDFKSYITK